MDVGDHVLVVDDDAEIRRLLGDYLRKNGYRATAVGDGNAMWAALSRGKVDLIVLDLMLPGEDGLSLCRRLRADFDTPVIMLTARGEETDRVVGLEMGADDYLAKPFSPRELLARVKTVLRRYRALPMRLRADDAARIRFAGWTLDVSARHLVSADGVLTPLGGAEYQLLRVFLSHPGVVLSRDQLMTLAKGRETEPFERTIDLRVSRLRQRLGDDAGEPRIIKTVRGQGYVLAVPVEMEQ
jgi:two-component system OmpR family response regulator